jgi:hypothetical protein
MKEATERNKTFGTRKLTGRKTKEGKRRGNRTKNTKVNEKGHYTQLDQPTTIITEVRMLSVRKSNY